MTREKFEFLRAKHLKFISLFEINKSSRFVTSSAKIIPKVRIASIDRILLTIVNLEKNKAKMNFRDHFQTSKEAQKYNSFGAKVSALLDFDKNRVANFNTLEKHKMITMISKAPGKEKLQITFAHRSSENSFFDESSEKINRPGWDGFPSFTS